MNRAEYQEKYKEQLLNLKMVGYYRIATTKDRNYFIKFGAVEKLDYMHIGKVDYAIFYNPKTKDVRAIWETDWDNEGLRDEDFENQLVKSIYGGDIVDEVYKDYKNECAIRITKWEEEKKQAEKEKRLKWGIIAEGDTVEIIKGRKLPIGEIKIVKDLFQYKKAGYTVCTYAIFTDGTSTNRENCKLIKQA